MQMNGTKHLLAYSGGLDSTVMLEEVLAKHPKERVHCVYFDYGSRHCEQERAAGYTIVTKLYQQGHNVGMHTVDIPVLQGLNSALTNADVEVSDDITDPHSSNVVPWRNFIILGQLYALAESYEIPYIYYGMQADDHGGFWDCTPTFIDRIREISVLNQKNNTILLTPHLHRKKVEVVGLAHRYGVDIDATYSCYRGGEEPCHECVTCQVRDNAIKEFNERLGRGSH